MSGTALALDTNPSEQIATLRRLGVLGDTFADFAKVVDLHDEEAAYERMLAIGAFLGGSHDTMRWWIGDYLVFSEVALGDRFYQLAETLGLRPQTLMMYARVARLVPKGARRSTLRFSHHRAVCALHPRLREQWLDRAERERLSAEELEGLLRGERNGHEPASGQADVVEIPTKLDVAARAAIESARRTPDGYLISEHVFKKLRDALATD